MFCVVNNFAGVLNNIWLETTYPKILVWNNFIRPYNLMTESPKYYNKIHPKYLDCLVTSLTTNFIQNFYIKNVDETLFEDFYKGFNIILIAEICLACGISQKSFVWFKLFAFNILAISTLGDEAHILILPYSFDQLG